MKTLTPKKLSLVKIGAWIAALTCLPNVMWSADILWIGGTSSYTNAANWSTATVPGPGDNAIATNGIGNVVQINAGNPDWTVTDLAAGGTNGAGAYQQNGQTVNVNGWMLLGSGDNGIGTYTLNNGTLNVLGGRIFLGDHVNSTSTLNINGGVINKTGDVFVLADGGWNGSGGRTGTVNHVGGTVNSSSEIWIGQVALGVGIYNLHAGGTINSTNWFVVGRAGGDGTMNMDGGSILQVSGGTPAFIVGDGAIGTLNQSGGTITTTAGEYWVGNNGGAFATNNVGGSAVINVNNWIAYGRGGIGVLNQTGGAINKTGNGNVVLGAFGGSLGIVNQSGGTFTNTTSETWIGETTVGIWNQNGGTAALGVVHLAQNAGSGGTLNLNGGTLFASEITTGNVGGSSTLNFNGGTLIPTADTTSFIHDVALTSVGPGDAVFNTAGFNVTVPQALLNTGNNGGLTKNGAGTLTLTGGNNYSGATTVNAGKLAVNTDSSANGGYTIANGGELSIKVQAANAQLNVASVTLGVGSPKVSFELGGFGNPTQAPLNSSGVLTVDGTVVVSISDEAPQLGQFPLIKYSTRAGTGSFVLGTLPFGVVATIVTNVGNSSIDINITSVNLPRWDGQAGGNWDIGLTTNWVNIGDGLPTFFGQGNAVVFNDSALGTTTANLVTTVNPTSVTFNNSTLAYTLVGVGKISGATGVTKQGLATAAILNTGGNNYTGPTIVSGGTLTVTNLANGGIASAIGASSSNPTNVLLNGGTLDYAGPATTINRGYAVGGTNGSLSVQSNLTLSGQVVAGVGAAFAKGGPAQLTYVGTGSNVLSGSGSAGYTVQNGTVRFDGSAPGGQTNTIQGTLRVGDVNVGANAAVTVTNARVIVTGSMELGNSSGATSTLTVNSNAFMTVVANPFAVGRGTSTGMIVHNAGTLDVRNELWIGQGLNGFGSYTLSSGSLLIGNWLAIGRASGQGILNMTGGTVTKNGGGNFIIGTGAGNNTLQSGGILNQSGGTITCDNEYWIAENVGSSGTNNISGTAVLNLNNWMSIGRGGTGVVNFTSGTINRQGNGAAFIVGDGGTGFFFHTGGALNCNNELWVGQGGNGNGRYDLSGASTISVNNWVAIGRGGGTGAFNMSGGTFTKTGNSGNHFIIGAGGPGSLNQSGGTVTSVLSETWIGESQTAVWNLSGGAVNLSVAHMPQNNGTLATFNLNGGTLSATEFTTGNAGGRGTLNMNGGTLVAANGANPNFLHDLATNNVLAGGAFIDSGTNVINVAQPLLDGGGNGGLTKSGTGTLRLNGVNTYTGTTTVSAGTLGGTGTIAGPVNVAAGASFAPGASIGTLTINNSLTLAASSSTAVEISLNGGTTNSDLVTGLTAVNYGGALIVSNVGTNGLAFGSKYKLFNAAGPIAGNFSSVTVLPQGSGTFNPATGELTITSVPPPLIGGQTVIGGSLVLTGSGGTPGGSYTWLTATNIATPIWTTNSVGTFTGSGTFTNAFPINALEKARFFKLQVP